MIHLHYHANCADGFAAACIARHAFMNSQSARLPVTDAPSPLRLHPIGYEDTLQCPLGIGSGDHVYYVDYTPPSPTITSILASGARLTMIDHHKTAAARYVNLPESDKINILYDTSQSGAMLTWKHFFGDAAIPPLPLVLLQHYDLGGVWDDPRHPLTNQARWLTTYLMRGLPRTPEAWSPVLLDYVHYQTRALEIGARLHACDQRLIRGLVKAVNWVNIGGLEVPALNGIPRGLLNDAVNELLIEHPDALFAASWSVLPDSGGVIKWSLRSRKNGFDCATLCQTLDPNGGGHPQAAGFSTTDPVHFV